MKASTWTCFSWFLFILGTFVNLFFLAYLMSPKFCHRFVGYLEEEAVKTYTHCLEVYTGNIQFVVVVFFFNCRTQIMRLHCFNSECELIPFNNHANNLFPVWWEGTCRHHWEHPHRNILVRPAPPTPGNECIARFISKSSSTLSSSFYLPRCIILEIKILKALLFSL